MGMPFVTLCVTQGFCDVRWIEVRLRSPFRPSASYFDGAKVTIMYGQPTPCNRSSMSGKACLR
ncbi:hypothetical protein CXB35_26265 [Pseudomonas syringae]|nr:hypothetical protein CXB35_26265 [Pseudomonas syringae]